MTQGVKGDISYQASRATVYDAPTAKTSEGRGEKLLHLGRITEDRSVEVCFLSWPIDLAPHKRLYLFAIMLLKGAFTSKAKLIRGYAGVHTK